MSNREFDSDELDICNFRAPVISKKSDTLVCLPLDHESPFIRTTSNIDIFNTLPDYKMPASCIDWTLQIGRNSETEMNSHSYATLASAEESTMGGCSALGLKNSSETSGCWPFMFDNSYQQSSQKELFHTSSSDIVSPSQLVGATDFATLSGSQDSPFPGDYSILDAIQALGTDAFSTSFAEKVADRETKSMDSVEKNLGVNHTQHQISPFYLNTSDSSDVSNKNYNYLISDNQSSLWSPDYAAMAHNYWMATAQAQNSTFPQLSLQLPINAPPLSKPPQRPSRPSKKERNKKEDGSAVCLPAHSDNNGNRRRSSQHTIFCSECETQIGVVFIRGTFNFSHAQPTNITCKSCSKLEPSNNSTVQDEEYNEEEYVEKKRKRKDEQVVDCEVCHGCIGVGGISSSYVADGGEVKAEFVCTDCGDKYMFCSECGGGGKQRTGKWRPRELFESGRRTCSLPHIRVGTAEVHYKVMSVKDLTTDVLQGIQDVFFDCLLSLYCVPSIMMSSKFGTFDAIKAEIEKLWLSSVLDVLTNNVLHGEKYVTVAWIQKRHRNKGVGKPNAAKDIKPWLQKLNLNGIISGGSKPSGEEDHQCFVAFSIAEWDIASQSIFLAQMAPRSVFLKTMEGYVDLIKNCVSTIHKQASQACIAKPTHIWCWAKPDHARLQSIPIRLKFVPRDEYLSINPKLNPESFDRLDYEPLQTEGTVIYASSVKPFAPKY